MQTSWQGRTSTTRIQRCSWSNHQKVARTGAHVLTNKHLNIPFCDLSISGYSGKTANAAPFTTLSRENPSRSAGTVQLLHIPRPVQR